MTDEVRVAMELVVNYLDAQMEKKPSRELADVSNYLQELLDAS